MCDVHRVMCDDAHDHTGRRFWNRNHLKYMIYKNTIYFHQTHHLASPFSFMPSHIE